VWRGKGRPTMQPWPAMPWQRLPTSQVAKSVPNDHQFTTPWPSPRPGQHSFHFARTLTTSSAPCPRTDETNMNSNKALSASSRRAMGNGNDQWPMGWSLPLPRTRQGMRRTGMTERTSEQDCRTWPGPAKRTRRGGGSEMHTERSIAELHATTNKHTICTVHKTQRCCPASQINNTRQDQARIMIIVEWSGVEWREERLAPSLIKHPSCTKWTPS
jgi:hypothetical protein